MPRHYRKHKKYKKRYYSNYQDEYGEEIFWTVVTIIILYFIFWGIFWIGAGLIVMVIGYLVHLLNKKFNRYRTRLFRAPIISYLLTMGLLVIGGWQISFYFGKIDTTFRDRAKEGSNYITINGRKGHIDIEPNIEGIVQRALPQR